MRQMQKNAGSGAMGFGKSKAKLLTEKHGRVTFDDVAGIDERARSCRRSSSS
jgi:cell division protease FtsH